MANFNSDMSHAGISDPSQFRDDKSKYLQFLLSSPADGFKSGSEVRAKIINKRAFFESFPDPEDKSKMRSVEVSEEFMRRYLSIWIEKDKNTVKGMPESLIRNPLAISSVR